MSRSADPSGVLALSRLFSYPEEWPQPSDLLSAGVAAEGTAAEGGEPFPLRRLQAEYVRLFINALPEVPCPPYGSFYLEGMLMGQNTVRLRKLYARYGLEPLEAPDHVAVEMEFLAFLDGLPAPAEARELRVHLRDWLPSFLERVEANDTLGLYRAAAGRARDLLLA